MVHIIIDMTLDQPNLLDLLCAHVTMGGSSIDFCHDHNIRYDHLSAWLYDDPKRLERYNAALDARTEWLVQRVLLELKRIAIADFREAWNDNGTLKDIKSLSPGIAACLASVEIEELYDGTGKDRTWIGYTKKIRFWNKNEALALLGKNLAMFIERHDHLVRGTVQVMPAVTVDNKPLRYDLGGAN